MDEPSNLGSRSLQRTELYWSFDYDKFPQNLRTWLKWLRISQLIFPIVTCNYVTTFNKQVIILYKNILHQWHNSLIICFNDPLSALELNVESHSIQWLNEKRRKLSSRLMTGNFRWQPCVAPFNSKVGASSKVIMMVFVKLVEILCKNR